MPAFLAAIPAFIAALPALIQLTAKFMTLTVGLVEWAKEKQLAKWMEEVEDSIDMLRGAKTTDEKTAAAHKLSDLMRGLG